MSIQSSSTRAPMYFRIQQGILLQIQQGMLKPGQQLPTESDLVQQYQVSRITAKRALDELVRQGVAFRQQGRGTFVAQTRIREISGFGSFTEDMLSRGLVPSSQVLLFEEVQPDKEIQEKLQISPNEHAYILKRLRLANGEKVAFETTYLPCRFYPGLLLEDLAKKSLYTILSEKYQMTPTWADAEMEAASANKEEAGLLNLEIGKPVLIARRVTFSANYDVVEVATSLYRGDLFTFYSGRQLIG